MHGVVDGPAVNDGVPANAIVVRLAIGFEIPKDVGSPLILVVMQDHGIVGCCFKLQRFIHQT